MVSLLPLTRCVSTRTEHVIPYAIWAGLGNALSHVAVNFNHGAVPLNVADITRFEQRLCVFSFVRTVWFYIPVLVHHIVVELRAAGAEQPHALAMSTLVIFSLGILLAAYPSGVFADLGGTQASPGAVVSPACRGHVDLRRFKHTACPVRGPAGAWLWRGVSVRCRFCPAA